MTNSNYNINQKQWIRRKRKLEENKEFIEIRNQFRPIQSTLTHISERSKRMINNIEPTRKFDRLYEFFSNENFLIQCYGNIEKNKGSLTPGTTLETADEMALNKLKNLAIQMKNQNFKFTNIRRKLIEKPKRLKAGEQKKFRPLGIPNFTDRIIQEGIRIILESIYEPIFQKNESNYGFRPKRGAHHCIQKLKVYGTGSKFAIEGDIEGAYDNVDHDILKSLLEKQISDQKFINLIYSGFKAGILENNKISNSITGVPQGGLASPILFNIYMHEFDMFIEEELRFQINVDNYLQGRNYKPRNKLYNRTQTSLDRTRNKYKSFLKNRKWIELSITEKKIALEYRNKLKVLSNLRTKIPSIRPSKKDMNIVYTRYADDWIILINSTYEYAQNIKSKIATWLEQNLKFKLSPMKTFITNIQKDPAKFLGFSLKGYSTRRLSLNKYGESTKRAGWDLIVDIDIKRVIDRLFLKGFLNKKDKPIAKNPWAVLSEQEIINRYNYIIRGMANYYLPVIDRLSVFNRICYFLKFSCLGTFAKKFNLKITKITQKFGDPLTITINEKVTLKKLDKTVEKSKTFTLLTYKKILENLKYKRFNWKKQIILVPNDKIFEPMVTINWRTKRNLTNCCLICGTFDNVELHHVKHIRIGKIIGFQQVLKQLNRKTVPLCKTHHKEVHQGKYSDLKLTDLYDIKRFLS